MSLFCNASQNYHYFARLVRLALQKRHYSFSREALAEQVLGIIHENDTML